MSTDYQQARSALGARLRELRTCCPQGRLTGTQLAGRLGWTQSKVSKLENGRQTATAEDLRAWATATGRPETFDELHARLRGFESHIRSWRRQLAAGHRPVQDTWNELVADTSVIHEWEPAMVSGLLQTADYARHVFIRYAELQNSPRDTEEAVRSRMRRQEWLYRPGSKLHVLLWEAALHSLVCPPSVLTAQLDRLTGVVGMDTVELGIVPMGAPLKVPAARPSVNATGCHPPTPAPADCQCRREPARARRASTRRRPTATVEMPCGPRPSREGGWGRRRRGAIPCRRMPRTMVLSFVDIE